jgi:hypothetical protein
MWFCSVRGWWQTVRCSMAGEQFPGVSVALLCSPLCGDIIIVQYCIDAASAVRLQWGGRLFIESSPPSHVREQYEGT